MIKIVVSGIGGHMGKILSDMIINKNDNNMKLVAGVDKFISTDSLYDGKVKCFKSFNDIDVDYDIIIDFFCVVCIIGAKSTYTFMCTLR